MVQKCIDSSFYAGHGSRNLHMCSCLVGYVEEVNYSPGQVVLKRAQAQHSSMTREEEDAKGGNPVRGKEGRRVETKEEGEDEGNDKEEQGSVRKEEEDAGKCWKRSGGREKRPETKASARQSGMELPGIIFSLTRSTCLTVVPPSLPLLINLLPTLQSSFLSHTRLVF